jgi:hypothetical protein
MGEYNLKGFGIGNGFTSPYDHIATHADHFSHLGLCDEREREVIRGHQDRSRGHMDAKRWIDAKKERDALFRYVSSITGGVVTQDFRFYESYDFTDIIRFVNTPQVREMLHVGNHTFDSMRSVAVEAALEEEFMQSVAHYLPELLENNYKALLFQGLVCL